MTGIIHKAVKASGEKGLATEWNDDHAQDGNHDVEQHQFLNQVIENRTDFPAGPVEGQTIYRTDLKATYVFDGTDWVTYAPAIKKGTHYLSLSPHQFTTYDPDTDQMMRGISKVYAQTDAITFTAPVNLPDGAVVTAVIIYGDAGAAGETGGLVRIDRVDGFTEMAAGNIGTEDTTISVPTIDNENYSYAIWTSSLDTNDTLYGARITYTL